MHCEYVTVIDEEVNEQIINNMDVQLTKLINKNKFVLNRNYWNNMDNIKILIEVLECLKEHKILIYIKNIYIIK